MLSKTTPKFTKMLIIVELIVVSYLLYTLTVSVYKSYQIDMIISEFERENDRIAEDNRKKMEDYEYYTSDSYVEKIAKQNMGLINPGEEVIVIASNLKTEQKNSGFSADNEDRSELSNMRKWQVFFFDKDE